MEIWTDMPKCFRSELIQFVSIIRSKFVKYIKIGLINVMWENPPYLYPPTGEFAISFTPCPILSIIYQVLMIIPL